MTTGFRQAVALLISCGELAASAQGTDPRTYGQKTLYAVGTGAAEFDRDNSLRTLREIPMDLVTWSVKNSNRLDVPVDPLPDRSDRRQALVVLPYDERPMWKWNESPYRLDGGDGGLSEDDGAYFLLPYWMGRYHKVLELIP